MQNDKSVFTCASRPPFCTSERLAGPEQRMSGTRQGTPLVRPGRPPLVDSRAGVDADATGDPVRVGRPDTRHWVMAPGI